MANKKPVSRKVKTASFASLLTSFLVGVVIQTFPSLSGMSETLTAVIGGIVVSAVALVTGYLTRHSQADQQYL
jgi:uncharacterized membrane protein YoaK (UPF0700 family)